MPFKPKSLPRPFGLHASLPTFLRIASTGPDFQVFLHKAAAAIFGSFDFLIIFIISSIFAIATIRPSTTWPLSFAFLKSYFVLLIMMSFLCLTKACSISLRFTSFGWPSDKTVKLIPNDCSNCVCANKLFSNTSTESPFLTSITTRNPSLSDSSLISVMPSIFFSLTSSAIFSNILALLTIKGISLTIKDCFPDLSSSIDVFERIWIIPLPVLYASYIPAFPSIVPPVGKSGPEISFINSSIDTFGLLIKLMQPFKTSVILWGGILVAIPTAIPDEPFTNKFGIFVGNTSGISSLPS